MENTSFQVGQLPSDWSRRLEIQYSDINMGNNNSVYQVTIALGALKKHFEFPSTCCYICALTTLHVHYFIYI